MDACVKQYIETSRLILRDWKEDDIPAFAKLNSDEEVMEYFLKKLSYQETLDFYRRIKDEFETCGYGLYAVERKEDSVFMGFVGLHGVTFDVDFAPAVEIGWRLLPEFWNKGYATEAALACMNHAKEQLKLNVLYSFTSLPNKRSERVMQKIGMKWVKEFDHPLVDTGHPLCRHVLYKIELN
ncbi:GNAT family N-acetyltransferase [Bacteroides sp.]